MQEQNKSQTFDPEKNWNTRGIISALFEDATGRHSIK